MKFDAFASYARSDNDDQWVDRFTDRLSSLHHKLVGEPLLLFLDRSSIVTGSVWEASINNALEESRLLIAVLSPSYVKSEWCRREWNHFVGREQKLRAEGALAPEQSLIVPILLYPLDRGRYNEQEAEFLRHVRGRQFYDLSSRLQGTPLRTSQLNEITEAIIDVTTDLVNPPALAIESAGMVIVDHSNNLTWSAALSDRQMSIQEAFEYISHLEVAGYRDWRLPTKEELESIIVEELIDPDPEAHPFPLKEPFRSQKYGYLHSSSLVSNNIRKGHFVMNLRNGHIFNGLGYEAFVRAIRSGS